MELAVILRAIAALSGVVLLILLCAWIARKLDIQKRLSAVRSQSRLQVVETLYIDARHRVVILRRDAREHVVMISATDTLLLESYDVPHS